LLAAIGSASLFRSSAALEHRVAEDAGELVDVCVARIEARHPALEAALPLIEGGLLAGCLGGLPRHGGEEGVSLDGEGEFELVGPWESDVSGGKLSVESPVGKCMMGRREGDEIAVDTPAGVRVYRILSIQI